MVFSSSFYNRDIIFGEWLKCDIQSPRCLAVPHVGNIQVRGHFGGSFVMRNLLSARVPDSEIRELLEGSTVSHSQGLKAEPWEAGARTGTGAGNNSHDPHTDPAAVSPSLPLVPSLCFSLFSAPCLSLSLSLSHLLPTFRMSVL